MRRMSVLAWARLHIVSILAAVAAVGVAGTWVLDVFFGLTPIGTFPVVYDICLAYLTGWLFNLLVVVIPERRKVLATMRTLRGNLMMIANNGRDLIRDLEFIGRCPERPITKDHLLKICTANNENEPMKLALAQRLSVARDAYRRVTPFLTSLPHDVAIAAQEVDQQFINLALDAPDHLLLPNDIGPDEESPQPSDLRAPVLVWIATTGPPIPKRQTLRGWKALIFDYYKSTERVRAAVEPYMEGPPVQSEGFDFWLLHKSKHPFTDYPEEASTDAWRSTPPPAPPIRLLNGPSPGSSLPD